MRRIRKLREEKRYTIERMAQLTCLDKDKYSRLEAGKEPFSVDQFRRVAVVLDTSMDYLAGLTDYKDFYPRDHRPES